MERVTLLDIARAAGVSKSTVARALADHPRAAGSTRRRIQALARELGYRPDPTLSWIAARRWRGTIGAAAHPLAFLASRAGDRERFWVPAAARAVELGYDLAYEDVRAYVSGRQLGRVLRARGVRGLLLGPIPTARSSPAMDLPWNYFTAVCCGRGRVRPPLHTATPDWFQTTREAWMEVLAHGAGRVGAVLMRHAPIAEDDVEREAAILFELGRARRSHRVPPFLWTTAADAARFPAWRERHRPGTIVAFPALRREIREDAVRAGVRVVTLGSQPGFPHPTDIARAALELLVDEIRRGALGLPDRARTVLLHGVPRPVFREEPKGSGGMKA